jgi:hypothetical protein
MKYVEWNTNNYPLIETHATSLGLLVFLSSNDIFYAYFISVPVELP